MIDTTTRRNLVILGKPIGTYVGWDEIDAYILQFYNIEFNELGNKFIHNVDVSEFEILAVDYINGKVELFKGDISQEIPKPDWSVFNKD